MASKPQFRINGLIDTKREVVENLNELASSSGCYLTWDPVQGKWIVVLNTTGSSIKSFDDSNIVGSVNVSGTGVNELYNKVSVQYPNKDTRDTVDVIDVEIDSADRFANELDNTLELRLSAVNDYTQAQYLATRELKQNRLDKIIEFRSNFEANECKAGDLIDVTNAPLGYTNKVFRIIQIDEEDTEEGVILYSIIAQEYDANVYSEAGLTYELRSNFNGIKSKVFNAEIEQSDEADLGGTMAKLLGANALLGILNGLFKKFVTADEETGVLTEEIEFNNADTQKLMEAGAKKPDLTHAPSTTNLCPGVQETITFSHDCEVCFLNTPNYNYDYSFSGITDSEIDIPLTGTIAMSGNTGTLSFTPTVTADTTFTLTAGGNTTTYRALPEPTEYIEDVTATATTLTQGDNTNITVTTVGKTNGDTLNYTITGDTGSITTALTGTVTVNSNSASLTVTTADDSAYGETENVTVTFTPQVENFCSVTNNTVDLTIQNNGGTGPQPPADTTCEYTQVPVVWCGEYDGTTGALKGVTVRKSAYMPIPQAGEATVTVPAECSVVGGAIQIDSTIDVASSSSMGGIPYQVITSFNSVPANGLITGTTTTVYGYAL